MKKIIFKSAKLINHGLWKTEIELFKDKTEEDQKTYVQIRTTIDGDHITHERIKTFNNFVKAYNFFHDLLKDWL